MVEFLSFLAFRRRQKKKIRDKKDIGVCVQDSVSVVPPPLPERPLFKTTPSSRPPLIWTATTIFIFLFGGSFRGISVVFCEAGISNVHPPFGTLRALPFGAPPFASPPPLPRRPLPGDPPLPFSPFPPVRSPHFVKGHGPSLGGGRGVF